MAHQVSPSKTRGGHYVKEKQTCQGGNQIKSILRTKIKPCLLTIRMIVFWLLCYTERHKLLRTHKQRSACLKLCGSFKINVSKTEYAIYYDAV